MQDNDDVMPNVSGRSDLILFIQEMLIDVFGIVIPGFCLIFLSGFSLIFPAIDLARELGSSSDYIYAIGDFIENNSFVTFISILVFSFVVGHLLYRQDPKWPDMQSITRRWAVIEETGCVRHRKYEADQFPYGHLKEFLKDRGLDYLAEFVPWSGKCFDRERRKNNPKYISKANRRSKHFINSIKLYIKNADGKIYFDILRNEAHIRLMSSVWHGALFLIFSSSVGLSAGIVANALRRSNGTFLQVRYFEAILFPLLVLLSAIIVRRSIAGFFHYQRVREIVFVLEAFHLTRSPESDAQSGTRAVQG